MIIGYIFKIVLLVRIFEYFQFYRTYFYNNKSFLYFTVIYLFISLNHINDA
jgi:hypothetical protein